VLVGPRLSQPQHARSQRPELTWLEPNSHQAALRVPEPEDRLSCVPVLADGDDAGDIDELAGGLTTGALLLGSCHEAMVAPDPLFGREGRARAARPSALLAVDDGREDQDETKPQKNPPAVSCELATQQQTYGKRLLVYRIASSPHEVRRENNERWCQSKEPVLADRVS
jgi:hypothetical protein